MIEIPGYAIKREISSSEIAGVYLAVQTSLDREVAIKALQAAISADAAAATYFQKQARQLASLSHPNIVSIYDVGATAQGLSYFCMQYLSGGDFAARVNRGLNDADLTETLAAVARALGYVHQRGLLHRALAPRKVLYDGNGTPVLTYFGGSAPVADSHLTNTGFAIGNSHYMSPEQARGGEVSARSDIYALGALAYYGLVGRPPYDGVDGFAVAYAHVFEPIPRLPADKAHWQPLIDEALAKDPKDRYASAEEFLDALTGVGLDFAAERADTKPALPTGRVPPVQVQVPVAAPIPVSAPSPAVTPVPIKSKIVAIPKAPPIAPKPVPSKPASAPAATAVMTAAPTPAPAPPPQSSTVLASAPPSPQVAPLPVAAVARVEPVRTELPATVVAASLPSRANLDEALRPVTPTPPSAPETPAPPPSSSVAPRAKRETSIARQWLSVLALLVVVIGLCAIGYTLLTNYVRHPQTTGGASGETKVVSSGAPAAAQQVASTAPAAVIEVPPVNDVPAKEAATTSPAIVAGNATTTVGSDTNTTAAVTATPDAQLNVLDAAEAQALGESVDLNKIPTVVDPLPESIRLGRIDFAGQRLTTPPGANALERFQFALKLDPKSKGAKQGIVDIAKKYTELADKAQAAADQVQFGQYLERAETVAKLVPEGQEIEKAVAQRRQKAAEPSVAQGKAAAATWDREAAKAAYEKALQIDPNNAAAREGLKFVATIGEPGFAFHDDFADGGHAPDLVILAGGRVAMGRNDVTRSDFRKFWNDAGRAQFAGKEPNCRDRESIFRSSKKRNWENPDIAQDDSHPVVCVGWAQASAYAQWLSKQTGKHYRLPSATEFDQIATKAPASDCKTANVADAAFNHQFDSHAGAACDDGFAATSPVGHFAAAGPGIHDIDGNVRIWVAACGNGAPAQPGSACRDFLVKGRSWLSVAAKESATYSDTFAADVALNSVGLRIVRDIEK